MDYGRVRTGIAALIGGLAIPLDPLVGEDWSGLLERMRALMSEHGEGPVVLGLPLSAFGRHTALSREVERLAAYLAGAGLDVVLESEVGTSAEARDAGVKDRRNGRFDSAAAAVLLKRHLGMP